MKTVTIADVPHSLIFAGIYEQLGPGVVTTVTFTEEQRQEIFKEFEGKNTSDIRWEESKLIQSYKTSTNAVYLF